MLIRQSVDVDNNGECDEFKTSPPVSGDSPLDKSV